MLKLPPIGSRGVQVPRLIRPLVRGLIDSVGGFIFRRGGKVQGRPLVRLITMGAKTGQRRTTLLGWFPDEDHPESWIVVASNGGAAQHPAWAYNLAAHPDQVRVDVGAGELPVTAEILTGAERENAWAEVVAAAPGYGRYQKQTDREIPIFRLTPRP